MNTNANKQEFSPEEEAIITDMLTYSVPLMVELKKQRKRGVVVNGVVECPKCHGQLDYTVSGYNGHTYGKCRTPNCLQWVE